MRQRRWIFLSALGGIVLILVAAFLPLVTSEARRSDPSYQGKALSVWLRAFDSYDVQARLRAVDAVQHIGTNALPLLTAQLRDNGPKQEHWWRAELRTLVSVVHITVPFPRSPRREALTGLDALGPAAKEAAPFLENLLRENPPDTRAALVLARLGSSGVPALTRALTNDQKAVRFGARVCLDMIDSHSKALFPTAPHNAGFDERISLFNLEVVKAALAEYKKEHSD
jgi:hypothetical protein